MFLYRLNVIFRHFFVNKFIFIIYEKNKVYIDQHHNQQDSFHEKINDLKNITSQFYCIRHI